MHGLIRSAQIRMLPGAVLLFIALVSSSAADVPASQQDEVKHLLDFIRSSTCRLERNNSFYQGDEAVDHILGKYDYYRDEIKNTESFIELSASKSILSGKPYVAHCEGQKPINSSEWLMRELGRYRESIKAR